MPEELSTHELLVRIKQGVEGVEAEAILYARYKDRFVRIAGRYGWRDGQDGEDITQDFFIDRILPPGLNYNPSRGASAPSAGHAWIMTVFYHYLYDLLDKQGRRPSPMPIDKLLEQLEQIENTGADEVTYIAGVPVDKLFDALLCAQQQVSGKDMEIIVNPRQDGPTRGELPNARKVERAAASARLRVALDECLASLGYKVAT